MSEVAGILNVGTWQQRLDVIVRTMREMSRQTDPQEMVRAYGRNMSELFPTDGFLAVSRRDLEAPCYRITRSSRWDGDVNPWKSKDELPLLEGGLIGDLLYGDEPQIIDELQLSDDDPAAAYFEGMRSLVAVPLYDQGTALNMVLFMWKDSSAFSHEDLPELVWMSNLFGRATHNLVLAEQLEAAYQMVDREMRIVGEIQQSLLPPRLPNIPNVNLAARYETSQRAGGDYYDFFPLPEGRWGILLADVSGHGTSAAVLMAVTHSIAHMYPGPPDSPERMLAFLNEQIFARYVGDTGRFVTAFYGIFDPASRELTYASAGHHPPRLRRCRDGTVQSLDGPRNFPLGVSAEEKFTQSTRQIFAGDRVLFYTDGVSEAQNAQGDLFGTRRIDEVLAHCSADADELLQLMLTSLREFTDGRPLTDDRTLLVADVS